MFASLGSKVVVSDLGAAVSGEGGSNRPADDVVAEIRDAGGVAVASYDDVSDFKMAGNIIGTAIESFGRVDVLVNTAGVFQIRLFKDMSEQDWDRMIAVHLKGAFNMCRHAIPHMIKQGGGRIINTTSSHWRNPTGMAAYAAAKGGVVSLTWDLAWEFQQSGITVNAIAPLADTRMSRFAGMSTARGEEVGLENKARADEEGRGGPEWVAPMVAWLASDAARHVNGCVFRVGSGKIGIYSHPTELRTIYREHKLSDPWKLSELDVLLPATVLSGPTKAPHIPA